MSLYIMAVVAYIEESSLAMVSGMVGLSSCGSGCIVSVCLISGGIIPNVSFDSLLKFTCANVCID